MPRWRPIWLRNWRAGTENASITALHVVATGQSPRQIFATSERQFRQTLGRRFLTTGVTRKTVVGDDTAQVILDELGAGYDTVLMGTSREALIDRLSFGEVPQRVAEESPATVIVARRHMPVVTRAFRDTWQALTDALPLLTADERDEVRAVIRQGARSRADFFVMIGLAAVLAALGLLLNSPAVIIGAMLVAPLMSAIVGLGLGVVEGDTPLLGAAAWATFRGMVLAILVGALLGLVIPDASATPEIMTRARPSVLDLGVALASGAAGAYALCRKDVSAGLAGVAIAAALVPPLATVGIGLALGRGEHRRRRAPALPHQPDRHCRGRRPDFPHARLRAAGQPEGPAQRAAARAGRRGRVAGGGHGDPGHPHRAGAAVGAPGSRGAGRRQRRGRRAAARQRIGGTEADPTEDGTLQLAVTVRSSEQYPYATVLAFQREVATRIQRPVALLLNVIPATRLDPLVPPTFTPMPTPTLTATLGPTAIATASPTETPPIPTAAATATLMPTLAPTATATATPSPTATVTATATATPRPTPGFAVIANANGQGANLRSSPGGTVIGAVGEGTPVILLGERVEAGGKDWARVAVPGKPGGWIATDYLELAPAQP